MSVFDPENVKQSEGSVHHKHLFVSGGVAQEVTKMKLQINPHIFTEFRLISPFVCLTF